MYNRKQGFSYVARMPQSVEPWTNGGLCDVCQPSHGNFLLADLSNSITYQLAKQRAVRLSKPGLVADGLAAEVDLLGGGWFSPR